MANQVPFVAYFKITPDRGSGKRFEVVRSRERISHLIWSDLNAYLTAANLTIPSTVHWGLAENPDSLASTVSGVAIRPQFGEEPDMATVVGFCNASIEIPYGTKTLISGGAVQVGPATGPKGWDAMPSTSNQAAAKVLKSELLSAIISVPVELIKLEIAGVAYGRGGFHFPQ